MRLTGLPPIAGPDTRLLVLGSFPGARSLAAGQYYAHPQNQFWKILSALWAEDLETMRYQARTDALLKRGLGLWDVYAACERKGSLDAAIRHAEPNDLAALAGRCPRLAAVAHNGGESFRHARRTRENFGHAHPGALGLPVHRLPSTSPAHASWTFERKLESWRAVFTQSGVA